MKIVFVTLWIIYIGLCVDRYKSIRKYREFVYIDTASGIFCAFFIATGLTVSGSIIFFDIMELGVLALSGIYSLHLIPWLTANYLGNRRLSVGSYISNFWSDIKPIRERVVSAMSTFVSLFL